MTTNISGNSSFTNLSDYEVKDHAFDQLLPTLIECFTIILCGYLCGRLKVLSKSEMVGLNFFSTNFALPSLLFLNLATLDLTGVNWSFVGGITLGKFLVFVGVGSVIALMVKPVNLATIAIYSIFCTHVNDFGLAYPILQSIYEEKHPAYPDYMYVIGLISLVVLNPIGFCLIEIEAAKKEATAVAATRRSPRSALCMATSKWHSIVAPYLHVFRRVLTNPNVFMTALGVIANVAFQGHLPLTIRGILKTLSATFQGSVLFLLGFQVAGASLITVSNFLVPGILLVIKMLLSPLLTRGTVQIFCSGADDATELADYGFLYGTVPTAPVVLLYASQFGMATEMLATTLVVCTFLSAPIMYVSARMLAVQAYDVLEYLVQIRETIICLSVLSLIACIWVAFLFCVRGKWKTPPHSITLALIVSQALMSVGLLCWSLNGANSSEGWRLYFEIVTITGGQMASRFWTALIAISLCLNQRGLCEGLKYTQYLMGLGVGLPVIATVCLMVTTSLTEVIKYGKNGVPSFLFGENEACMAVVILSFCLVTTMGCLVVFFRSKCLLDRMLEASFNLTIDTNCDSDLGGKNAFDLPVSGEICEIKVEEFDSKPSEIENSKVLKERTTSERTLISDTISSLSDKDVKNDDLDVKERQCLRHASLLILLCISMMVGLTTSIWKVLADRQTGIFVALEFLDVVLNYGQALFCFCIFGHDINVIVVPIVKFVTKLKNRRKKVENTIDVEELDEDTQYVCFQFMIYHYDRCYKELPRDKVWKRKKHESVFWGWEMVDWLLEQGLSRSRQDATKLGNKLLRGKVIKVVDKNRATNQFYDGHYFYTFYVDLGN